MIKKKDTCGSETSASLCLYVCMGIYIYIYVFVWVRVCVCVYLCRDVIYRGQTAS